MSEDPPPSTPRPWPRRMIIVVLVLVILPVAFLASRSILSPTPAISKPVDGGLRGCPQSPNCVCSNAEDDEHHIEALRLRGDAETAMTRLRDVIQSFPRAKVVDADGTWMHAEFTTLVFRYVDDVEFLVDSDAGEIQVRSSSRTGYSDLGANRSRVEAVRAAWDQFHESN